MKQTWRRLGSLSELPTLDRFVPQTRSFDTSKPIEVEKEADRSLRKLKEMNKNDEKIKS